MLADPSVAVVGSWLNRKFRRRFRVPYSMFLEIVEECKQYNVFGVQIRKSKIATEYKVLSCLKILGRDLCADELDENLNIAESTVNKFFKMFITNYANSLYSKWVYVPEGEELDAVVKVYEHMGFPGCIGSMDVTHIYWDKCPERLRFLCKGKEGKPTVAFQAVVEHTKRIQHISKPFYGATNDITITYQDTYPMKLLSKQVHADRVFQTYNRTGDVTYWKGAYLLTDGGYPKVAMLMDTSIKDFDYYTVMWAEWLESIRKDVECVFGILKQRFRWLRNKVAYHDIMLIYKAFQVAAILHNRLLLYDGYDKFDWENCDPDEEEPQEEYAPAFTEQEYDNEEDGEIIEEPIVPGTLTQHPVGSQENPIPWSQGNYWQLKHALMKHLSFAYTQGKLAWPKHFSKFQKRKMPLLTKALSRVDQLSRTHFRIAPSTMRRRNSVTSAYSETIGNGLFSQKKFKPGDHLLNFVGNVISKTEYVRRTEIGRGGYILANRNETCFLDCFDQARTNTCWASMANSPYGCHVAGTNIAATANARLVTFAHGNGTYTWSLKAILPIPRGQEILFNYGRNYIYPTQYASALL